MKKIPIGLSDFKKLIEGNYYYFDKTNFIDEIIKDGSKVKLFARPRRFGKTLNMSMLKFFFNIREAEENRKLFENLYIEKTENFGERGNKLIDLMEALTENRIDDYEETLQDILLKSASYNDTKKGNEAFYHGFILGMSLYLEGEYIVKSNIESGLGRYDVSIEPKNKNKRGYILEFKATDNIDRLEEISKEALKQIEEGKYSSTLKQTDTKEILYLGIAFCGKQIKVSYK